MSKIFFTSLIHASNRKKYEYKGICITLTKQLSGIFLCRVCNSLVTGKTENNFGVVTIKLSPADDVDHGCNLIWNKHSTGKITKHRLYNYVDALVPRPRVLAWLFINERVLCNYNLFGVRLRNIFFRLCVFRHLTNILIMASH